MKYVALTAVFLTTAFGVVSVAAAADCPGADVPVTEGAGAASSTLCLVNGERAAAGAPALVSHPQLEASARAYAQRLVAERFFSHVASDGSTFFDRLERSGYADARFVAGGENLGWLGGAATPRAMVTAWMASAGHRANMLDPRLSDSGLAVVAATPTGVPGATFVHELGAREEAASPPAPSGSQKKAKKKSKKSKKSKKRHSRH